MADEQVALTQEVLKDRVNYDPETGVFTWAKTYSNKAIKGRKAGSLRLGSGGYNYIRLFDKLYPASRLAVLYMIGTMPEFVDHIDRDRANDQWSNLRVCTRSQNQCNRPKQQNNTSGFKGVSRRGKGWFAQIKRYGKNAYLGQYSSPEEAHAAYVKAAQELHGEFACT